MVKQSRKNNALIATASGSVEYVKRRKTSELGGPAPTGANSEKHKSTLTILPQVELCLGGKDSESPSLIGCAAPSSPGIATEQDACAATAAVVKNSSKENSEIDDLFGQLKSSKNKVKLDDEKPAVSHPPPPPRVQGSKDDLFGTEDGKSRKRTEEGYVIYTEDELGFNKKNAGGTPLCPFDCDCCY